MREATRDELRRDSETFQALSKRREPDCAKLAARSVFQTAAVQQTVEKLRRTTEFLQRELRRKG